MYETDVVAQLFDDKERAKEFIVEHAQELTDQDDVQNIMMFVDKNILQSLLNLNSGLSILKDYFVKEA